MGKRCCRVLGAVVCTILVMATACVGGQRSNDELLIRIQKTIAQIRAMKGPPSMARTNKAEHLADLTGKINPGEVDDKTLEDLISLLNSAPDDSVRGKVAAALGNLGPRAKAAVPALLKDIHDTDCWFSELKSAAAARLALKRIGVTPPPQPTCKEMKFPPYHE